MDPPADEHAGMVMASASAGKGKGKNKSKGEEATVDEEAFLAKYKMGQELGRGSYSIVKLATNRKTKEKVQKLFPY
jgi:hypothetical protein